MDDESVRHFFFFFVASIVTPPTDWHCLFVECQASLRCETGPVFILHLMGRYLDDRSLDVDSLETHSRRIDVAKVVIWIIWSCVSSAIGFDFILIDGHCRVEPRGIQRLITYFVCKNSIGQNRNRIVYYQSTNRP